MKPPRTIALLTDFGIHDHYVGAMKGVIAGIAPQTRIIDITHQVKPHAIKQGGYLLWAAFPYLPPKTIFIGVVDPGVGSGRQILCIEFENITVLVPDNGLADFLIHDFPVKRAFNVKNSQLFLETTSTTFHGRDIFAPVAAHLSRGVKIDKVGSEITLPAVEDPFIEHPGKYRCSILHIDRFGNIITNVRVSDHKVNSTLVKKGRTLIKRHYRSYKEIPDGDVGILQGSSKLMEISARQTNAAAMLDVHVGNTLEVIIP
ncbi:MAG: SAM-dependent chlorinase/fluorinase [Bacteroidota bacterium]